MCCIFRFGDLRCAFPLKSRKRGHKKILGWAARLHSPQILCSQFLRVRRLFSRRRAQRRVASATAVISSLSSTRLVHGRFTWPSKLWKVDRRPRCALGHSAESNSDFVSLVFHYLFFLSAWCLLNFRVYCKCLHFSFSSVCWALPVSFTVTDITGDKKKAVVPQKGS